MELNERQLAAVMAPPGPVLVAAGPGSGKTFTITHRISYLTGHLHIPPEKILVLSFTRSSASEIRSRYEKLVHEKKTGVTFGTMHSVFFGMLRTLPEYRMAKVLSGKDRRDLMRSVWHRMRLQYGRRELPGAEILESELSGFHRGLVREKEPGSERFHIDTDVLRRFDELFVLEKKKRSYVDYEDMIRECLCRMEDDPSFRARWQQTYTEILVDEFQDTSEMQFRLLRILSDPEGHLYAVGDDDQSIYGFRGAYPENMLKMERYYPGLTVVRLEENYRCAPAVVTHAGRLISHNRHRIGKQIVCAGKRGSNSRGNGSGDKEAVKSLSLHCWKKRKEQAADIAERIRALRNRDRASTVGVLTRMHSGLYHIADSLKRNGVSFRMDQRSDSFMDGVREDLLAYLRLSTGEMRRADLSRILQKPRRYLFDPSFPEETVSPEDLAAYERELMPGKEKQAFRKLKEDLKIMGTLPPDLAISYAMKQVGYENWLLLRAEKQLKDPEDPVSMIGEWMTIASGFDSTDMFVRHMTEDKGSAAPEGKPFVFLSTIHQAKGLEYDAVFLPDLCEGKLPHHSAGSLRETEEERRLMYVAMTRAAGELHLYTCEEENDLGWKPSRFLSEMLSADEKKCKDIFLDVK